MKLVLTPDLLSEMMALNVDPPGTAWMGCSSRKMMSSTVSPIPIIFRIFFVFGGKDTKIKVKGILKSEKFADDLKKSSKFKVQSSKYFVLLHPK